jgi:hypothetical protein
LRRSGTQLDNKSSEVWEALFTEVPIAAY